MEEVDSIILHFLRRLNVAIPDDLKSLIELSPPTIVNAVSICLNTIKPTLKAPENLPSGISHRIEIAAHVASMCKDLGYKSEVGYQTFLYQHEAELRKVFMFLIECLPKEQEELKPVVQEDDMSVLWSNIRSTIAKEMETIWVPYTIKSNGNKYARGDDCTDNAVYKNNYFKNEERILKLYNKIISKEPISDLSNSESKNEVIDQTHKIDTKQEENAQVRNIDVNILKEKSCDLREQLSVIKTEKKNLESDLSQITKTKDKLDTEIKQVQSINNITRELGINFSEGLDNMIDKLKLELDRLHLKSDECTHKNLSLKAEIEKTKREKLNSNSERSKCMQTIEELKKTGRELKKEYMNKEQSNTRLRKEYEKLNQTGMKRSFYTKKIMEIIGNVAKQKIEIHKILNDTRQLQKEINSLNGQLDRSFSIADETLFGDAKKDDQSKKAYKLLALLHSECNTIVSLVNDTGTLSREIVELEDHIEEEKSKRVEETLKRIRYDLGEMQEEIENMLSNQCT